MPFEYQEEAPTFHLKLELTEEAAKSLARLTGNLGAANGTPGNVELYTQFNAFCHMHDLQQLRFSSEELSL